MKSCYKLWVFVMILAMSFSVYAEITFHGDARVRPRVDQTYNEEEKVTQDIYYLYWIRIWMNAELTDGWFAKAKLSTDGPADFIGKMGADGNYDGSSNWDRNNSNGVVRWSEAYFGRNTDKGGFSMGVLPLNGLKNPELDIHYFPGTRSDIPYFIYNRNSATGFRGYYQTDNGKLCATVTVDDNMGKYHVDSSDTYNDIKDQYSAMINYTAKVGEMTFQPTVLKTFAPEGRMSPLTAGVNFVAPKLSDISLSGGLYYTMQGEENAVARSGSSVTGKYSGMMLHAKASAKAGPGSVIGWIDYTSIDMDAADDKLNTYYLWIMYKYVVYQSEVGSFSLMPTFRRIGQTFGDVEFARHKIEITMHITFK